MKRRRKESNKHKEWNSKEWLTKINFAQAICMRKAYLPKPRRSLELVLVLVYLLTFTKVILTFSFSSNKLKLPKDWHNRKWRQINLNTSINRKNELISIVYIHQCVYKIFWYHVYQHISLTLSFVTCTKNYITDLPINLF